MEKHREPRRAEIRESDTFPQGPDFLELGKASAETRGCLGIFEDVVCQFQPGGIDPN